MALVEIARLQDVYEADLAAAFLSSHGIEVSVTERFQTTVDPLMQRALGIRLMVPAGQADEARDLLARAQSGEFAEADGDDLPDATPVVKGAGVALAIATFAAGAFWGSNRPRRLRAPSWQGMLLSALLVAAAFLIVAAVTNLLLNPPRG